MAWLLAFVAETSKLVRITKSSSLLLIEESKGLPIATTSALSCARSRHVPALEDVSNTSNRDYKRFMNEPLRNCSSAELPGPVHRNYSHATDDRNYAAMG